MPRSCALFCLLLVSAPAGQAEDKLFIVHFFTGPAWDTTKAPSEQVNFAEHSANLGRLRSEGVIRFGGRYEEFGLVVLNSSSLETAREIIEADPGVKSGLFRFRIAPFSVFYPWKE